MFCYSISYSASSPIANHIISNIVLHWLLFSQQLPSTNLRHGVLRYIQNCAIIEAISVWKVRLDLPQIYDLLHRSVLRYTQHCVLNEAISDVKSETEFAKSESATFHLKFAKNVPRAIWGMHC